MISRLPYPMRCTVNSLSLAILVFLGACSIIPNPFSRSPSPASGDGERRSSPNELLREEIFRDGEADPTAYELYNACARIGFELVVKFLWDPQRQPMHSCT